MRNAPPWVSRGLLFTGLAGVIAGTLDPLEGSVLILVGFVLVAAAAHLYRSRHRIALDWSVALVAVGVAAMFILSAYGGFGGTSGRSNWWALAIVPYPIGWIIGLVESIRLTRDSRTLRKT